MSNGGQRLKELLARERYTLKEVAEAIGLRRETLSVWTTTAPIDKLYAIAKYTNIDIHEIIECFNPDRDQLIPADRTGGENN
jgi:transcriptional regulator with XRE-family HTH domain